VTVFIIDRELDKAAAFAAAGAILTFFGFIHGEGIGFGRSPEVALAYLAVAVMLFACHRYATVTPHLIEGAHGGAATAGAAEWCALA